MADIFCTCYKVKNSYRKMLEKIKLVVQIINIGKLKMLSSGVSAEATRNLFLIFHSSKDLKVDKKA